VVVQQRRDPGKADHVGLKHGYKINKLDKKVPA